MIYTIENDYLKVDVETLGAQLKSIYSKVEKTEYLWQGNPDYWAGRAYNLFPIVGRLFENKYTYGGKTYEMNPHGFSRRTEYTLTEKTDTEMAFCISSTDETFKQYPFEFILTVRYILTGNKLTVAFKVKNVGSGKMYFGLGGHPGFNIPFGGGNFEDYYVEFDGECKPRQLTLSENYLLSGKTREFPLENDRILRLKHELFDDDAVILQGHTRSVKIKSGKTDRYVGVEFPRGKYLGIWHKPHSDAPFVCIEPWENLPSVDGKVEDLTEKDNIGVVEAGESYNTFFAIEIK
ncbi:MAG: aldose 1-epimerase family protein [Clostridia bacterium]|nr:aldose 1-epimerase family protein [Clostridia bacterium]